MRQLNEYISVGAKRMRCGYTTGTCAAGATRAAAEYLLAENEIVAVEVETPSGIKVTLDIEELQAGDDWASCAVQKDAGDDPDVTDGALVYARVSLTEAAGIKIDGGLGVGRVTKPGLDQPVGEAAINSVPRKMIAAQLREAADRHAYQGGFEVVISIPSGVDLAEKTFNPKLGIEGGISVLGTSGIVRPMSEDALVASLELEMSQYRAEGAEHLLLAPGNYGRDFAREELELDTSHCVQCSNYIGKAMDAAVRMGFKTVLIVGHIGKLVKVSAGIMNTHSHVADARSETIAAHAALQGATRCTVAQIMESVTTDDMLDHLDEAELKDAVCKSIMTKLTQQLNAHSADSTRIEAIMFSKVHGLLGATPNAEELVELHRARHDEEENSND